jgi:hypothetical protein
MLIKIINVMLLSAGVLFSQIDSILNYSDELAGNEIDLIITSPIKLKNKKTGEMVTYYIEKKITGVSKILSKNDSTINVWNGRSKFIDLAKIKAIRIVDPVNQSYILAGSLSGFVIGLLSGLTVANINLKNMAGDMKIIGNSILSFTEV